MNDPWEPIQALVVVRTYPVPSKQSVEVSCTAAITTNSEWLRLFPVPYRLLDEEKQFKKYQWISVRGRRSGDSRPESRRIDVDSIQVLSAPLSTDSEWAERRRVVMPLKSSSMCALRSQRDKDGKPTLGLVKPASVKRLVLEHIGEAWSEPQRSRLQQSPLWGNTPNRELEKIPYRFSYEYTCEEQTCTGHTQMCSDWEMAQAYRRYRDSYGSQWENMFRERFELVLPEKKDLHFYVGTVNDHPASWIIVGLWYPPIEQQGILSLP